MNQLENRRFCSTNKTTAGFDWPIRKQQVLMGQLGGNRMFCSTNKKQQVFDWPIENSSFFHGPIRKPHDFANQ